MANMQGAPTSGQQEEQKTALEQYGINLTEIAKSADPDLALESLSHLLDAAGDEKIAQRTIGCRKKLHPRSYSSAKLLRRR